METEIAYPSDASFYKGHFPGFPVTPGVMLIDSAVANAEKMMGCEIVLDCIKKVKFSKPVLPGESILLRLDRRGDREIAYSFSKDAVQCASGVLVYSIKGTSAP